MSRPHRSPEGFRRSMQMSATRVFVLVEGKRTDPFFYAELAGSVCEAAGLSYEIVRANLFGDGGGKQILSKLYEYLQANKSLSDRTKGAPSLCVFYLDKDVDDILRDLIRSPHVVYTPFYTVENTLFVHGELVKAAAAAASLEVAAIRARIPDNGAWLREKAEQWKDFVVLCLLSRKNSLNCDCNYGCNTSPLNYPPEAPTDKVAVLARKAELQVRLGLPAERFERKFRAAARLIDRIYRSGQHGVVFNGKWYRGLLVREIELAAGGQEYDKSSLANSLISALRASLDFNAGWADHFKDPLRELIKVEMSAAA